MRWRHFDADAPVARRGADNMALDQWMMESVRGGAPAALRFYAWDPACLSFGRNQPAAGLYDEKAAHADGIDFVRRPTGGQAVLHHLELTYAVALPLGLLGTPRATYHRINQALVAGLRQLGVAAEVAPPATGARAAAWAAPCFRDAAPGEVVVAGRKLVGSAQRTADRVILQHGSVLLAGDQSEVARLRRDAVPQPRAETHSTLAALLGGAPDRAELARALAAGFADALGIALAPAVLSRFDGERVSDLAAHFGSAAWTWRR